MAETKRPALSALRKARPQLQTTPVHSKKPSPSPLPVLRAEETEEVEEFIDDEYTSSLAVSVEPEPLPLPEATTPQQTKPEVAPKRKKSKESFMVAPADKIEHRAIDHYGPLPISILALSRGKKYTSRKERYAFMEKAGHYRSVKAYGLKIYLLTALGQESIYSINDKPEDLKGRLGWRHDWMVATQAFTIANVFPPKPVDPDGFRTPWVGKGKRILGEKYADVPMPVISERVIVSHSHQAQKMLARAYGNTASGVDLYRKDWRAKAKAVLTDPAYPVVPASDTNRGYMDASTKKQIEDYWFRGGDGDNCALLTHWDDRYEYSVKRDRRKSESHYSRPDAVVALPHVQHPDGTITAGSLAIEVELNTKGVDFYHVRIPQFIDHPAIGGIVFITDDPRVASAIKTAKRLLVEEGVVTKEQFAKFPVMIRKPALVNGHIDPEGYLG